VRKRKLLVVEEVGGLVWAVSTASISIRRWALRWALDFDVCLKYLLRAHSKMTF
jgi:hypothetical protein